MLIYTRSTPEESLAQPTMLLASCALTIVSLARPSQESPASETTLTMHLSASNNSAEGFALHFFMDYMNALHMIV